MTCINHSVSDDFIKRFWSKVTIGEPDACWVWTGCRAKDGYGRLTRDGKSHTAHRIAWGFSNGPIPDGMHVLHRCDFPPCCNPAHLWIGTNADNVRDKTAKGRNNSPTGDRHKSRTKPESVARGDRSGSRTKPESLARGDRNGTHTKPDRVARGERQGSAKLTEADVRAIRAANGLLQREIASMYGVSHNLIGLIRRRVIWTHVP